MALDPSKAWAASLVDEHKDRDHGPEDRHNDIELEELLTPRPSHRDWVRPSVPTTRTEIRAVNVAARLNPQFWHANSNPPILRREITGLDGTYFHRPAGHGSVLFTARNEEDKQYVVNHRFVKPPGTQPRWRDHRNERREGQGEGQGQGEDDAEDIDEDLGFVLDNIHGIESEIGRLDVLAAMAQERRFVLPVVMVCLGIAERDEQVQQKGIAFAARFIADPDMADKFGDFVAALDQLDPTVAAEVKHRVCEIRVSQRQEQVARRLAGTNQVGFVQIARLEKNLYAAISAVSSAMVRFRSSFWSNATDMIPPGGRHSVLVRLCTYMAYKT